MNKFKNTLLIVMTVLMMFSCQKDDDETNDNSLSDIDKKTILNLVNEVRKTGCNCGNEKMNPVDTVIWNEFLEISATQHCIDMFKNNFFSHDGSDGSTPAQRLLKTGFTFTSCGENNSMGPKSEQQVFDGWLNSPGHCKNIMNRNFKYIGAARCGEYWTLVFAGK